MSLMQKAAELLLEGGILFLYGPFFVQGRETAPSNLEFHQSLQARNPQWGLRELESVCAEAIRQGLVLEQTLAMPANNLSVVFRKKTH